jgi:two-component system sensor histidine kinase BaeS
VSLRTRLVAAFMTVALVVLALSGLATYLVVRRSLQEHAVASLRARADALPGVYEALVAGTPDARPRQRLRRLTAGLKLTDMTAVTITPAGAVIPIDATDGALPAPLTASDLDPAALYAGNEVSGRRGNTVYLAVPGRTIANRRLAVVATDTVDLTVLHNSVPLMIAASAFVLLLALGLALWFARRLTRPIAAIEDTAARLSHGDLTARTDVPPGTDSELTTLAATLDAMAAQLEQSRGSERAFLLSISHDLRTPLTSIRGYAEALADGTLDDANAEDRKRAATVIGAEARRLERLVRDLLDLARLDSRQFSLNVRACDANEVVRDAVTAFQPQARDLGIELTVTPGTVLPVELDPERLGQIVANLVENALKYATAHVSVYATTHDPQRIAVVVIDDGPGIPTEQRPLVFDRLYTVRDTPGRSVGTGLGLAIVRELAAAMGGTASVDPSNEPGTRFLVVLPTGVSAPA